jgi:hypothetical protein
VKALNNSWAYWARLLSLVFIVSAMNRGIALTIASCIAAHWPKLGKTPFADTLLYLHVRVWYFPVAFLLLGFIKSEPKERLLFYVSLACMMWVFIVTFQLLYVAFRDFHSHA